MTDMSDFSLTTSNFFFAFFVMGYKGLAVSYHNNKYLSTENFERQREPLL